MSGIPPLTIGGIGIQTSIFDVFSKVDQILADIQILLQRSPTYVQFASALNQLQQEVASNQNQLLLMSEQLAAILQVLNAIVVGMATLANQQRIIADLEVVKRIGVDFGAVFTEPQNVPLREGP